MPDIRTLLANAHLNLPPLKKSENLENSKEIVLVQGTTNSLADKLSRHRKNDDPDDKQQKEDSFKWLKMKERMLIDMEHKRDEEWKKQTLNDKLENEEEDDEIDEIFEDDPVDDDDAVDNDDESAEQADDEEDDQEDNLLDHQAEEEGDCNSIHDELSDDEQIFSSKSKPKIIDDDDEDSSDDINKAAIINTSGIDKLDEGNDASSSSGFFNEDAHGHENFYPSSSYSQNPDRFCISQNLPLTPIYSEVKNDYHGLPLSSTNFNNDGNFDSQMLANLCSGQFKDLLDEPDENSSQLSDEKKENSFNSSNQSDIENGESENENDDLDEENDSEDEAEFESSQGKNNKKPKRNQFIDYEAELSGSENEVSSDENEDDEDDELLEQDDNQEELPSDDEIRGQLEKLHNKDLLDEDKRQLMILKELYFDDGDLHDENGDRKKKFKWQLNGEEGDDFINVLSDSEDDQDSNFDDSDNEQNQDKVIRLKRETTETTVREEVALAEEGTSHSEGISISKAMVQTRTQILHSMKRGKQSSKISSFFIKDERLKGILNKRSANFNEISNKRLKTQETKSIFDLLDC